jgi:hypothetical protein
VTVTPLTSLGAWAAGGAAEGAAAGTTAGAACMNIAAAAKSEPIMGLLPNNQAEV